MATGTDFNLPPERGETSRSDRAPGDDTSVPSSLSTRRGGRRPPRAARGTAKDQLYQQVDSHRGSLARGIQSLASTLESASRTEEVGVARPLLTRTAGMLRRTSERLENETTSELAADVEDRARERPGLVLAGCLAAGFALGRLLKR
ncbi:hypothetical protein A176_005396 [Myxococcus hansupus]|uniref:DUF883 domain-containing protein n=1 Tax=Pseudomyxococcus hansupus TaxID=1297742 RepID=A0A0H4X069_9BACT|nr:hypothetical protein [Myxococcus hansupus]AKQ68484.1 hypothetical protein A176_005396 [Myxococcus hansupus]